MALRIALLLFLSTLAGTPAIADTWVPATVQTYEAGNGRVRLTVTPRSISSPLAYFEDKVANVEPAGQPPAGATRASGRLERLGPGGDWALVWEGPLVNEISPASALVTDAGDYVVTFDNWHSMGHGGDVVVIYGAGGRLVRSLSLFDILPETYVLALPNSVSSLWWSGEHRLSEGMVILKVVVPGGDPFADDAAFIEIAVELDSGKVIPPTGPEWDGALAAAQARYAAIQRGEAERRAWMSLPLVVPDSEEVIDWHRYLGEAHSRLTSKEESGSLEFGPLFAVLSAPTADGYADSLEWLGYLLLNPEGDGTIMVASPSEENLARVLGRLAREVPPGSLRGETLYLALGADHWPELSAVLGPSGAKLIQVDPARPIPQRPERLPRQ